MTKVTTYKKRVGRPTPSMCREASAAATKAFVFDFGTETQGVYSCSKVTEIKTSNDFCLVEEGGLFSAQYKAYPIKKNSEIIFNAVESDIPVLFAPGITVNDQQPCTFRFDSGGARSNQQGNIG